MEIECWACCGEGHLSICYACHSTGYLKCIDNLYNFFILCNVCRGGKVSNFFVVCDVCKGHCFV